MAGAEEVFAAARSPARDAQAASCSTAAGSTAHSPPALDEVHVAYPVTDTFSSATRTPPTSRPPPFPRLSSRRATTPAGHATATLGAAFGARSRAAWTPAWWSTTSPEGGGGATSSYWPTLSASASRAGLARLSPLAIEAGDGRRRCTCTTRQHRLPNAIAGRARRDALDASRRRPPLLPSRARDRQHRHRGPRLPARRRRGGDRRRPRGAGRRAAWLVGRARPGAARPPPPRAAVPLRAHHLDTSPYLPLDVERATARGPPRAVAHRLAGDDRREPCRSALTTVARTHPEVSPRTPPRVAPGEAIAANGVRRRATRTPWRAPGRPRWAQPRVDLDLARPRPQHRERRDLAQEHAAAASPRRRSNGREQHRRRPRRARRRSPARGGDHPLHLHASGEAGSVKPRKRSTTRTAGAPRKPARAAEAGQAGPLTPDRAVGAPTRGPARAPPRRLHRRPAQRLSPAAAPRPVSSLHRASVSSSGGPKSNTSRRRARRAAARAARRRLVDPRRRRARRRTRERLSRETRPTAHVARDGLRRPVERVASRRRPRCGRPARRRARTTKSRLDGSTPRRRRGSAASPSAARPPADDAPRVGQPRSSLIVTSPRPR